MLLFISTRSSHQRCSTKTLFWKIFAIVTRSTCAGVFCCEHCEIFRNICLEEHLWAAASRVFLLEAVVQRCSVKKVFLKISQDSQENTCSRVCFLNKVTSLTLQLYQKETLAQVLSNEFCEIFKNIFFFTEHLLVLLLFPSAMLLCVLQERC